MSQSPSTVSHHPQSLAPGTATVTKTETAAGTATGTATATATRARTGSGSPLSWDSPAASTAATPTAPKTSRRSHPKSRTGCRTCKRRKIKCDEQKPACRNCIKHAVSCDFLQTHPVAAKAHAPESSAGGFGPAAGDDPAASLGMPGQGQDAGAGGTTVDDDLDMLDLELMHNFTSFTYATLSSDATVRDMFRTSVVRMALDCDYVMRSLLAVSALHLAHFRPDRREKLYVARACMHHRAASQSAVPLLLHLKREDCENLYLFSILTIYFVLGHPRKSADSLLIGEAVFPQWLFLLRSIDPVIHTINPRTYRGPLAPLFAHGAHRHHAVIRDPSRPEDSPTSLLRDLERLVAKTCAEPELVPIYHAAIGHLRRILGMAIPGATTTTADDVSDGYAPLAQQRPLLLDASDIFVWQWTVANDLLPLLKGPAARQEAVAIFAHFLILLKKLESQWWLDGWAAHLMGMVWAALDQEHRLWIRWPVEELGWVPPG
ncbi:hypothetical protein ACRALDRAFT_1072597 [Sodiomyces alcalophilus JCM 7366]|uniref:uncharacterized protein n=1 Tax=Sodiomyces alcalophilus JCM 7366 TaxID=591952 RepID=UPI0039B61327